MKGPLLALCPVLLVYACDADPAPAPPEPAGPGPRQVLFGDLHVHSSHSTDAALVSAPLLAGEGVGGPARHCDFARYCAQLDFWAITDHPEGALPQRWADAKDAIRTCNQLEGGYGESPGLVSFVGWEWTQSAEDPSADWGHKNVVFRDDGDDQLPARPIGATQGVMSLSPDLMEALITAATETDPDNEDTYEELGSGIVGGLRSDLCDPAADSRELPHDCREVAETPAALYDKLDEWGFDTLVIPHGTTWGSHHPALVGWSRQLNRTQHRPEYERLIEVYSGHGNSEEHRAWRHVQQEPDGSLSCPQPTPDFEPCCYRAGEIVRARYAGCREEPDGQRCADAVARARQDYIAGGLRGGDSLPNVAPEDWGDCGQCRDCFQPAFRYRPGFSVQAALALSDLSQPTPLRYHLGFVGSTDTHRAGPGAGYKEFREMSDNADAARPDWQSLVGAATGTAFPEWERQSSYWYAGGLVAVHADGRSREAIWEALKRREVYATSGERMLLWFDLVNGPDGQAVPMGEAATVREAPTFEVRATGAFAQADGCPAEVTAAAPEGFVETYCFGECYHPTDERLRVTRVEVVKITPQIREDEPMEGLIHDPWRTLTCEPDPAGCTVRFQDEELLAGGRPASYYVRVFQEPTPQFAADNLRCELQPDGFCAGARPCRGGFLAEGDDCLADDEERAWSSPIFLTPSSAAAVP